jgi:hypothetical protein
MNRDFKFAHRMPAGQIADCIAGQKKDRAGFPGGFAQLTERMPLVTRKPVLQKIDVIGHPFSLLPPPRFSAKWLMLLLLLRTSGKAGKPVH